MNKLFPECLLIILVFSEAVIFPESVYLPESPLNTSARMIGRK
uniref:Uncharacterized protein n=1 Tax=Meloidogyne enterolobii TaxID=390850 RepID=A0A6V7UXX1_MELEN|nr:unnamed protein product [Meloidogyne enterolobii]